jgi:hypothetical protein
MEVVLYDEISESTVLHVVELELFKHRGVPTMLLPFLLLTINKPIDCLQN